ncbi:hypothetical protein BV20DRAFT_1035360 [Pilatotrama ljubarskyi]|nr:hypothetical protein BV20DRAFT_1035360 [Pilatotrama ljubarskyi]
MHLIWENVMKNLMNLWSGHYKDLDEGSESYQFPSAIWDEIGCSSAASGDFIPFIFGPRPPNVASDKMSWTAELRSLWTLYVAPVVLRGRFSRPKYYEHFIELVRLIKLCLQFELMEDEIDSIKSGFVKWVRDYETIYYQNDPQRLSACPLTIHALLHIADSIRFAGPVWASWAFPMERYCGSLVPAIKNRRYPYASLDRHVLDKARLTHIKLMYGIGNQLTFRPEAAESQNTIFVPSYDSCVLLPARRPLTPSRGLREKIVGCLATRYTATPAAVRTALPATVQEWAKVRILNGGDTVRSSSLDTAGDDGCNASYVRYELLVDQNARYRGRPVILEKRTFYGELQHILLVDIGPIPSATPPLPQGETLLLAVIQTCSIESSDARLDIHFYKRLGRTEVVDLTTVQCVVGRVHDRGQYGIIDRSGTLSRALYVE